MVPPQVNFGGTSRLGLMGGSVQQVSRGASTGFPYHRAVSCSPASVCPASLRALQLGGFTLSPSP